MFWLRIVCFEIFIYFLFVWKITLLTPFTPITLEIPKSFVSQSIAYKHPIRWNIYYLHFWFVRFLHFKRFLFQLLLLHCCFSFSKRASWIRKHKTCTRFYIFNISSPSTHILHIHAHFFNFDSNYKTIHYHCSIHSLHISFVLLMKMKYPGAFDLDGTFARHLNGSTLQFK